MGAQLPIADDSEWIGNRNSALCGARMRGRLWPRRGSPTPRVETAFAEVRREDFLGPGPWLVVGSLGDYIPTASADPAFLYLDRVVGILPERHLNNGQPSLHAKRASSRAACCARFEKTIKE